MTWLKIRWKLLTIMTLIAFTNLYAFPFQIVYDLRAQTQAQVTAHIGISLNNFYSDQLCCEKKENIESAIVHTTNHFEKYLFNQYLSWWKLTNNYYKQSLKQEKETQIDWIRAQVRLTPPNELLKSHQNRQTSIALIQALIKFCGPFHVIKWFQPRSAMERRNKREFPENSKFDQNSLIQFQYFWSHDVRNTLKLRREFIIPHCSL